MQLVYLETASVGLRWFKQYYAERPELNWSVARRTLQVTTDAIKINPNSGRQFDDFENVFERQLVKTAFSLLYTVQSDNIYIIDIRDQRGLRSAAALQVFTKELRQKYGL